MMSPHFVVLIAERLSEANQQHVPTFVASLVYGSYSLLPEAEVRRIEIDSDIASPSGPQDLSVQRFVSMAQEVWDGPIAYKAEVMPFDALQQMPITDGHHLQHDDVPVASIFSPAMEACSAAAEALRYMRAHRAIALASPFPGNADLRAGSIWLEDRIAQFASTLGIDEEALWRAYDQFVRVYGIGAVPERASPASDGSVLFDA